MFIWNKVICRIEIFLESARWIIQNLQHISFEAPRGIDNLDSTCTVASSVTQYTCKFFHPEKVSNQRKLAYTPLICIIISTKFLNFQFHLKVICWSLSVFSRNWYFYNFTSCDNCKNSPENANDGFEAESRLGTDSRSVFYVPLIMGQDCM